MLVLGGGPWCWSLGVLGGGYWWCSFVVDFGSGPGPWGSFVVVLGPGTWWSFVVVIGSGHCGSLGSLFVVLRGCSLGWSLTPKASITSTDRDQECELI